MKSEEKGKDVPFWALKKAAKKGKKLGRKGQIAKKEIDKKVPSLNFKKFDKKKDKE
jgi:hypothetical protein